MKIQEKILEEEKDKDLLITKLEAELVEKGEIIQKMKDVEVKNKILEAELTEKAEIIQKIKDVEVKNKILESALAEKDVELSIYKELAKHNQSTVDEIAKQPKQIKNTVINNKILNMLPFDLENSDFSEAIKNGFTENYLADGQKGVAQFAYDKLLKNDKGNLNYVCTDPSRNIFKYKTKEGILEKDINAKKLTSKLILGGICQKSLEITNYNSEDEDKFLFYAKQYSDINCMKVGDSLCFQKETSTLIS